MTTFLMQILHNNVSGIYKITNIVNNKCYIGSSANIKLRWCWHKTNLKKNQHHSKYLQRSYNKHGEDNFKYEILFTCPIKDLLRLEQYCINNYNSQYNLCKIAGSSRGVKASVETRKKLSIASKGRKHTAAAIQNMRIAQSGKIISQVAKQNMSKAKIGKESPNKWKSVQQICPSTNKILQTFNSVKEASIKLKIERGNISSAALGKRSFAGGFLWKYSTVQQ